jgi:signal transduction histidine kinase
MPLAVQPFDLRACIRTTVEMLHGKANEKNPLMELELTTDIPSPSTGDPSHLRQVLLNLHGNAIKFTHRGKVRITVQIRSIFLEFVITDTGIGIAEEHRRLLFQSFSQVDSSPTRKVGGTGLGLAISKGLVDLMGGEIWMQPREGGGSVFSFRLPLMTGYPAE